MPGSIMRTSTMRTSTMRTSTVPVLQLVHDEVGHLLERDAGGILAAPVRERRTGGLGIFEPGDVVARRARELRDRLFAHVMQQRRIAVARGQAGQHLFVALYRGLIGPEAVLQHLGRAGRREPLLEVHERQFLEGAPLLARERRLGRHVGGRPVLPRPQQVGRRIRRRVGEFAVGEGHRLEQHVGHDRPRVVAGGFPQPAVEPEGPLRVRGDLGSDPRQIRPVGARRLREVGMLVAGQAAPDLEHLLAALDVGSGRDALVGGDILERRARSLQVGDHGADLERLIPHRFLEALPLEVLPEAEEPRHLRARPEVLGIPQPRVEPVEAHLAGDVSQRRPHLGQRARGFRIFEERGERVRPGRELLLTAGITLDHLAEPLPRLTAIGARPHLLDPARHRRPHVRQPGVAGDRLGHLVVIRCQPHVGADPLAGTRPAVDLVAAVAAVLPDEVVALDELRRRRLGEPLAGLEVDDLMVTLQAARFLEPLGQHREDPVVVVEPPVLIVPLMPLFRRIGRVRGPLEARRAALPLVADRAPERLHRVRAGGAHEQVEPRVGGIGLWHAAADRHPQRTAPLRRLDEVGHGGVAGQRLAAVDVDDHVAGGQSGHGGGRLGQHGEHGRILGPEQPPRGEVEAVEVLELLVPVSRDGGCRGRFRRRGERDRDQIL